MAGSSSTPVTTRTATTSTSSSCQRAVAAAARAAAAARSTTARSTWPSSTTTAPATWLPLVHGQGALTVGQRLGRPGRRAAAHPAGGRRGRRDQAGPSGVDRREPEDRRRLPHPDQRHRQRRARPTRGRPTPTATSSSGASARRQHRDHVRVGHLRAGRRPGLRPDGRRSTRTTSSAHPTGSGFDDDGRMWIQTDISNSVAEPGRPRLRPHRQQPDAGGRPGRRARSAASWSGRAAARSPASTITPDQRTVFVNVQHPGEATAVLGRRPTPANPRAVSNWPDFDPEGRPRSATVVITKNDGGTIGS